MEDSNQGISPVMVTYIVGAIPVFLGISIIVNPGGTLKLGPFLGPEGLLVGQIVGVFAIIFGLSHGMAARYAKENLHHFMRFFAFGHGLVALAEIFIFLEGYIDWKMKYIFGTVFPYALALMLLLNSRVPAEPEAAE